jgi:hypothetical protein
VSVPGLRWPGPSGRPPACDAQGRERTTGNGRRLRWCLPLLALACLSGCVVPISPDFTDPPVAQNYPPQFLADTAMPPFLSETAMLKFSVTVTDPNVGDDLYVRWYVDYPPFSPGFTRALFAPVTTILHSAHGAQQFMPIDMTIDCTRDVLSSAIPRHQIAVLVGDRDFAPETADLSLLKSDPTVLTALKDGSHAVVAGWFLDRQCPGDGTTP